MGEGTYCRIESESKNHKNLNLVIFNHNTLLEIFALLFLIWECVKVTLLYAEAFHGFHI
jgi:hypothetical protein